MLTGDFARQERRDESVSRFVATCEISGIVVIDVIVVCGRESEIGSFKECDQTVFDKASRC